MNNRKLAVLDCECDLFRRKLRTKEQLREMWKDDPEAVEYLRNALRQPPEETVNRNLPYKD